MPKEDNSMADESSAGCGASGGANQRNSMIEYSFMGDAAPLSVRSGEVFEQRDFGQLWRMAVQVHDEAEGSSSDRRQRLFPFSQTRRGLRSAEELLYKDELQLEVDDEDEDEKEEEGDDEDYDAAMPWPEWFCSLAGNEFFAQVDEEFLLDDFNLTGLAPAVPHYQHALDLILDAEPGEFLILLTVLLVLIALLILFLLAEEVLDEEEEEAVQAAAELLYGLIHARFVVTAKGLAAMAAKHANGDFGCCPRVHCERQLCLPVGQSDLPRLHTVKLFCPRCRDIYHPRHIRHASIDGAFFGTTFPHLLCQTYPDLMPLSCTTSFVPRIFGFKVHRPPSLPRPVHERPPP